MNCVFCQKTDLNIYKDSYKDYQFANIYSCKDCNSNQFYNNIGILVKYTVELYYPDNNTEFVITTDTEHKDTVIFKFDDAWRLQSRNPVLIKLPGTFEVNPSNAEHFLNRILNQKAFL